MLHNQDTSTLMHVYHRKMRKQTIDANIYTNTAMQSLSVCRRGEEVTDRGKVGLQSGSQMEIDAVTLRTEVDLQAQKLRQSGKDSSSVTS